MAQEYAEIPVTDPLDRTFNLAAVRASSIAAVLALIAGVALRLFGLDQHALSQVEANWAHDAYRFFRGAALNPGETLPTTQPIALLSNSASFFFFGVTDATARFAGAALGIGTLALILLLRPFVGHASVAGIVALMAISPTLVFFSRTDVATSAGVFALTLVIVSLLRAGRERYDRPAPLRWPLFVGLGLGLAYASGPAALTGLVALGIGVGIASLSGDDAASAGLKSIAQSRSRFAGALGAFVVSILVLFSRGFSSFDSLEGIWLTLRDWGRMLGSTVTSTPSQFFVLALGLYEFMALVFAVVAIIVPRMREQRSIGAGLLGGWVLAALILFSISSGREPAQTAYIVLPLAMLGGCGLGELVARVDPLGRLGSRGWAFVALAISTVLSFAALLVLAGRIGDSADSRQAWIELLFVLIVVFLPFLAGSIALVRADRTMTGSSNATNWMLFVVAILLALVTWRVSTQLSFANADTSVEMLAQRTSTAAVVPMVERLYRLSLDNTRLEGTIADPTGGHGLSVAIDRQVEQPFAWYFREFPDVTITGEGQAAGIEADIVIALDDTGFAAAGYSAQPYSVINRVPGAYTEPDIAGILAGIFDPSNWRDSLEYLLYRDLAVPAAPVQVVVGLTDELANQVLPDSGPYGLLERVGPGNARGQFNGPRGIAQSSSGQIEVVDSGNGRVQIFDADGQFVAVWDESTGSAAFTVSSQGLGATGITVGADGLVYVADTWAHRVVVLDETGSVVRTFGQYGDSQDASDPNLNAGFFFGPRSIAVTDEEIFVVDTGNERVQVFGRDGSFKRAFGGTGTGPDQLIEPVGIAIGPDGLVYVADSGNARISLFTQAGEPVAQWSVDAWAGFAFFEPYLAFGADGLLYATSSATGSVEVFGRDGLLLGSITVSGSHTLGRPTGITTTTDGSLLITDMGNSGVYRVDPLVIENADAVGIEEASPSPEASPQP